MKNSLFCLLLALCGVLPLWGQPPRSEQELRTWEFRPGHDCEAREGWQPVTIPHDWAIRGPFSRDNDLQAVAVKQNLESAASIKTGRTGGLPYAGKGTYRRTLTIGEKNSDRFILLFDGAMSEAQVVVNGRKICSWPYGYNAFWCDATDALRAGDNSLCVLLENRPQSSRWYPGAGLYRKVRLLTLPEVHVPVWGTCVTTPYVGEEYASVTLRTQIEGLPDDALVRIETILRDSGGKQVAAKTDTRKLGRGESAEQHFTVGQPQLWSPETPVRYTAESTVYYQDKAVDTYTTPFGIRSIELRADKGFFLNGRCRKFRGACLHHDLGPLGAAVNKAAIRRQLTLLKQMGCDAVRTSHNMPAEELVELCDEMGLMVMVEPFDEWDVAKCENGYHRFFDEWAERDMVNMLRHFRNNPSVVMWSIGNEVPSQWTPDGGKMASWLLSICHREDPTRPVTCGMDQFDAVVDNGFAARLDIAGFNYKPSRYDEAYAKLPQNLVLATESASTVSSRGVYHFPVVKGGAILHADHQSSSYDTEHCDWSNIPDDDLAMDDDREWVVGQFVWTGFDYLGEPSPYDTDAWPNHSSVFGIVDLASIPKDRYWLYRSVWNRTEPTLHILPHWNWKGREGEVTPVFVYTSYPEAELFVNGESQGRRRKCDSTAMHRYRLMWNEVRYAPGELRVVAYDAAGAAAAEERVVTAGKPAAIRLTADRTQLSADGEDLAFVNVRLVDKAGNFVPTDTRPVTIRVRGAGSFRAMANGDPTSLELFHRPQMHLFSGQLTALVQSGATAGEITVEASAPGVRTCRIVLTAK